MKTIHKIGFALPALLAGAAPALAHTGLPGHEHGGFIAGLLHPASGMDHLLAMIAVGIWAAIAAKGNPAKLWIAPAAFVLAMLAGAVAGYAGVGLPLVETAIAASLVAFGVMIAGRFELPAAASAALVALFAVFHGHAHGAEAVGAIAAYMAGFTLMTASLHVVGLFIGTALPRMQQATTLVGSLIAAAGAYLLAA